MNPHNSPYVIIKIIAAIVALLVAGHAWRRRTAPGGVYFILGMLAVAFWSTATAIEYAVVPIAAKVLWSKLSYLGVVSVPPLWLLFALHYGQRPGWLVGRRVALLWIVPAITLLLTATNEWHTLIWPNIVPATAEPGSILIYAHGPAFWAHVFYSYSLMLLGTILLLRTAFRSMHLYRYQAGSMVVAAIIPWAANLLYLVGWIPLPGLDITPVAFALSGLIIAVGILRFQMLDIVPIARDVLVERISDGVLVLDAQDRVVDINPAACQFIGCTAKDSVGRPVDVVLAQWPAQINRYKEVKEVQAQIAIPASPEERWLELRISPLYDRPGQLTGRLVVVHDVTALHLHTRELEERNAELDAFAHTVAHDLRSPLTAMIGYSELLQERLSTTAMEDAAAQAHRLVQMGTRLSSIIEELLLLSSVRRLQSVPLGPLAMGEIVLEAQGRLAALIGEHQAELVMPDRWPVALGYAPWVTEVWVNYLSNAITYGGKPPRVELGWDEDVSAPPGGQGSSAPPRLRFWVRDNGQGLSAEEQARLFAEFTRLEQTRAKGHGLGLSIVRRIAERLGGGVGVESRVGQGSRFWFTLPGPAVVQGPSGTTPEE